MPHPVADGASILSTVPLGGVAVWVVALIVAILAVRMLFRIVKRIVGVLLLLAVILVLGLGGLGVLVGSIG